MAANETSLGRVIRSARERDGLSVRQLAAESPHLAGPAEADRRGREAAVRRHDRQDRRALRRSPYILMVAGGQVPLDEIRPVVDRVLAEVAAA
ncbi:MAG: hypothetical protein U0R69_13440 [Gaiellales bacterium]